MPYSGVDKKHTKKLERCVAKVLLRKNFKPQKGSTRKQSAIAICRASMKV